MAKMNEMMNDGYIDMREMLSDCLSDVRVRAAKKGAMGIPTGFQPLDDLIGGFEKGKVYVIGGRPCMGKEEFLLSMMININKGFWPSTVIYLLCTCFKAIWKSKSGKGWISD